MGKLTILAVDDDHDMLVLLEHLLKNKNYNVIVAENGKTALSILDELKPDIILLDILMQDMSGYEVCWRIHEREDLSFIPVIFLTALSSEKDKMKALSLGAVDFLSKPIKKELLYAVIEKHSTTENRWRRFLLREEAQAKATPERKTSQPQRDYPAFRDFLFKFLNIRLDDREKMRALTLQQLAEALQNTEALAQSRLAMLLAQFVGLEYLPTVHSEALLMDVLPPSFAKHHRVVTISFEDRFAFALADPFDMELLDTLNHLKPRKIFVAAPEEIAAVYEAAHEIDGEEDVGALAQNVGMLYPANIAGGEGNLPEADDERLDKINLNASPLVLFINRILENAYTQRASDIHIEPLEKSVIIRYRIDGELTVVHRLQPRYLINVIASRIKIMSQLNISERRLPQDGRFSFKHFASKPLDFDVRVSCAPMTHGEKIVMRILDKKKTLLPLESLGFSPRAIELYRKQLRSPYGMILHVGPTGSGKSMSLYSALNEINQPNINIQTAEDPVEYTLEGINQMQVNPGIGLSFKEALRCFLRQDPDVILVGEIRDRETAEIAVEAALTGHLLFSTLHTNDAPSTVIRFIEMGIAPYLISSSIVLICAQRLLRRLCPACKVPYAPDESEKSLAGVAPGDSATFYRPVGCPACNSTGFKGRVGVYELLVPNDFLRVAMTSENITSEAIREIAVEQCGMVSLFKDAMEKVREGVTSMKEAVSKTKADE
ncbi:MAG: ATPase, T2SS/T4P/T4SS family [Thermodesulfobacteriota bacterium]